ncbi:metal-dependent hydrolase [Sphingopyxis sp. P1IMeth2]|uniref:metal-dependent hydrolase n=1 Tax=Sphingopyxis sp. P1IMeth2 TaxID=1892848 RepID=UPI0016479D7B|nr:metal-dependent hydrolase [Sphingopyxis sp. P1IMeth2]
MDNLTHSLVGAALGQMGLKKKTALAMPTLILAANLPDIDASCAFYGVESLAMRRGITHGPIALLLLPVLLWTAMIAFDRWQTRRGTRPATRPPLHRGWLLALAYIGCLSHPALDWLNNYGVRLLEPFSHRWFYGDTLFIIDLWIWLALGLSVWLSLRRERRGAPDWQRPAWIGFTAVCAYIFANGVMTGQAEAQAADLLRRSGQGGALVVASPPPIAFWRRDIFWRGGGRYGSGAYALGQGSTVEPGVPTGMDDMRLRAWLKSDPPARAFLFWARMPVATRDGDAIVLHDQRYMQPLARDNFTVRVTAPDTASYP